MLGLSYTALKKCRTRGIRNGKWRTLDLLQRGFYRASMVFTKTSKNIVNPKMFMFLRKLIMKLISNTRTEAVRLGIQEVKRVTSIYSSSGVFNWSPIKSWLTEKSYYLWLGMLVFNSKQRRKN
jgi:hypothetical protein